MDAPAALRTELPHAREKSAAQTINIIILVDGLATLPQALATRGAGARALARALGRTLGAMCKKTLGTEAATDEGHKPKRFRAAA